MQSNAEASVNAQQDQRIAHQPHALAAAAMMSPFAAHSCKCCVSEDEQRLSASLSPSHGVTLSALCSLLSASALVYFIFFLEGLFPFEWRPPQGPHPPGKTYWYVTSSQSLLTSNQASYLYLTTRAYEARLDVCVVCVLCVCVSLSCVSIRQHTSAYVSCVCCVCV